MKLVRFMLFVSPLFLWIFVLFLSGSEIARYERSWDLIKGLLLILSPETPPHPDVSLVTMFQLNGAFRRLAHVFAYAILALLSIRAIQAGRATLRPESLSTALGLGIVFIALDEWHRRFQPNRHAKWNDVWLDLAGVTLTIVGTLLYFWLKSAEKKVASGDTATVSRLALSKNRENQPNALAGKE